MIDVAREIHGQEVKSRPSFLFFYFFELATATCTLWLDSLCYFFVLWVRKRSPLVQKESNMQIAEADAGPLF